MNSGVRPLSLSGECVRVCLCVHLCVSVLKAGHERPHISVAGLLATCVGETTGAVWLHALH